MSQPNENTLTAEQERALFKLLQEYESALKALHEKAIGKGYIQTVEDQPSSRPNRPGRPR